MPKEPTEAMRRIAAALIADPAEDELFRESGRTIVRLSDIENLMAMMFVIMSNHLLPADASKLFYEQGSLEKRMNLLNYIVRKWNRPKEVALWEVVYDELFEHKGVRNLIAHQGMFRHPPDETGKRAVSLRPPWLKNSGKGCYLNAAEIRATGDALEEIRGDLWALINILHDEPDESDDES